MHISPALIVIDASTFAFLANFIMVAESASAAPCSIQPWFFCRTATYMRARPAASSAGGRNTVLSIVSTELSEACLPYDLDTSSFGKNKIALAFIAEYNIFIAKAFLLN